MPSGRRLSKVAEAAPEPGDRSLPQAVRFSNPDKVFFPATDEHAPYTKLDVAAYYNEVADVLLPLLKGRPMVLRRYPNGVQGHFFFQKDFDQTAPPYVKKLRIWSEDKERVYEYVLVDNRETLLWLVQIGAIEMHPWLSRVGDDPDRCAQGVEGVESRACGLEFPDLLVIDIDPYVRQGRLGKRPTEAGGDPGISKEDFASASEVAFLTRDLLRSLGIRVWIKTSGKRGLHLYLPIRPKHTYEEVRAFAKTIGAHLAFERRDLVTLEYSKEKRAGRVFFDYNQNVRGKTLSSPWSVRPTPQASVSMPLRWDDLEGADPASFTIANVPDLLRSRGDPWSDFAPQDLDAILGSEG